MKSMIRVALVVMVLAIGSLAVSVQPSRDERDFGKPGAVSMEELRQEPITFELDIPHDDTGNPRQRLGLYLRKNPKSDKLPVIVFSHGGGWMQGDKSDGAGRLMPFHRTGQDTGVSVGCRLSGEVKWPAQFLLTYKTPFIVYSTHPKAFFYK
jgi:acetyl esterase/lipase